jgi:hypothetical protein
MTVEACWNLATLVLVLAPTSHERKSERRKRKKKKKKEKKK